MTFYHKLLVEDQRNSKMDINYWLDYVVKFGVKDLIPVYDKMGTIEYRNLDVYAMLWFVAAVIFYTVIKVIGMCCSSKNKVKVE